MTVTTSITYAVSYRRIDTLNTAEHNERTKEQTSGERTAKAKDDRSECFAGWQRTSKNTQSNLFSVRFFPSLFLRRFKISVRRPLAGWIASIKSRKSISPWMEKFHSFAKAPIRPVEIIWWMVLVVLMVVGVVMMVAVVDEIAVSELHFLWPLRVNVVEKLINARWKWQTSG